MQSDLDRFLALVCRELGADDARLLDEGQQAADDPCHLHCSMQGGRIIEVQFSSAPADHESKLHRLEMLVGTFEAMAEEDKALRRPSRPPVERALQDELLALCARALSVNAIVIDANSPVEWGAARPQEAIPLGSRGASRSSPATGEEARPDTDPPVSVVSRRALNIVRGLSELAALRKGKHLHYVDRTSEVPLIAHSFAGIYLLVLVFDGPLDELRAQRALVDALPRIERLVLALPPLEPSPHAGVLALRRPRRKS